MTLKEKEELKKKEAEQEMKAFVSKLFQEEQKKAYAACEIGTTMAYKQPTFTPSKGSELSEVVSNVLECLEGLTITQVNYVIRVVRETAHIGIQEL